MKKIIAILAALVLCFSFAMTAFAEDPAKTMLDTNQAKPESDTWDATGAVVGTDADGVVKVDSYDLTNTETTDDDNSIATKVDLRISNTQVSVCVPLKLSLVTDMMGGDVYAPASGNYYIENDSKGAVWVTKVEFSTPSIFHLTDATTIASKDYDYLYIPFKPADAADAYKTFCGNSAAYANIGTNWKIQGAAANKIDSATHRAPLGDGYKSIINISGGTATQLSTKEDQAEFFTITYTISATKPTA